MDNLSIKKPIRKKVGIAFAISLVIFILISLLSLMNMRSLEKNTRDVTELNQNIVLLENHLSNIKDVESTARGYELTSDNYFLQPYKDGLKKLQTDEAVLGSRLGSDPAQVTALTQLKDLTVKRISAMESVMASIQNTGKGDTSVIKQGRRIMQDIGAVISRIEERERIKLNEKIVDQGKSNEKTYTAIVASGIASLLFLSFAFIKIRNDLNKQNQIRDKLIENEALYKSILENFPDGTVTLADKELKIVLTEGLDLDDSGYTKEEFIGKNIFEFMPADIAEIYSKKISDAFKGLKNTFEIKTPKERYYIVHTVPIRNASGEIIFCQILTQNITNLKVIENELKEKNRLHNLILDNFPGGYIVLFDKDLRIKFINGGNLNSITPSHNLIGKHVREAVPPDEADFLIKQYNKVLKGESQSFEYFQKSYDRHHFISAIPLFNDNNEVESILAFVKEVTELRRLKNELEIRVEERTRQLNEINQELEAFTYSVSHDLRTPLRAINGFAGILMQDEIERLSPEGKKHLNTIRQNIDRMKDLIDDMLDFSRLSRREFNKSEVDMNNISRIVISEMKNQFNMNGEMKTKFLIENDLCPVKGDPPMIKQVMANLISNAVKYSHLKPDPEVRIGCYTTDGESVFYVKDNGVGFDMKYYDKLFGFFQRLHSQEEFEGTGIGLVIVKRIISKHGGKVWAEGVPGEGASFYFSLPVN